MTSDFTRDQQTAMNAISGELAISAGAGSGKTTVLAHRFANGLSDALGADTTAAEVDQILTITFTSKAAGEIAERVRRVVSEGATPELARRIDEAWISTIHTLCGRLVSRHSLEAGVEPGFTQADDVQARLLQSQAFESAVSALYGLNEGATRALDEFSYPVLRGGVVRLHEQVRSMGLLPEDITLTATVECAVGAARDAARCAQAAADALAEEKDTEPRRRACGEMLDYAATLKDCLVGDGLDHARVELISRAHKFKKMGSERSKEAIGELQVAHIALECAVVSLRALPVLHGIETLVQVFTKHYRQLKQERGVLDFDDLQERAAYLFEANPAIARRYREHFRMIMVDEFQDTNDLQLRVIKHLDNEDLCVVGDERQSIYGFRYADVRIFERIRRAIGRNITLQDNFRSHGDVLAFVNQVFSQPGLFGADFMRLRAGRTGGWEVPVAEGGVRVECIIADTADSLVDAGRRAEAAAIAQRGLEIVRRGVSPGDIAILVRNKTSVPIYVAAFEAAGLPVNVSAGQGFFDAVEIDDLLSLLRVIALPTDDEALVAVLASGLVGLSDDSLFALRVAAGRGGRLYDALRSLAAGEAVLDHISEVECAAAVAAFRSIESLRSRQGEVGLGALLHVAVEAFDYDLTLFAKGPDGARAWANVLKLVRFAEAFEIAESSDPGAFMEHMRMRDAEGGQESVASGESGGDAVSLMTIHASKGLEFPVVFVADLGVKSYGNASQFLVGISESGRVRTPVAGVKLPDGEVYGGTPTVEHGRLAKQQKLDETEEQKRCLYVACTRAQELLFLSGTADLGKPPGATLLDWIRCALDEPLHTDVIALPGVDVAVTVVVPCSDSVSISPPQEVAARPAPIYASRPAEEEERDDGPAIRMPKTVSYSGLHVYDQCPYSFYARSVLRLREFEVPTELSPAQFGSAVHAVLQNSAEDAPALGAIAAAAVRYGLDDTAVQRLETTVAGFLSSALNQRIHRAERVHREQPLRVAVGNSVLVGNVDLIAWEGTHALVVDYKTGAPLEAEDAVKTSAYRLQASCYALAALKAGADRVEVVFGFVEHAEQYVSFEFGPEAATPIEAAIEQRLDAMALGEYPHLAAFDVAVCQRCPALGGLCPVDDPRRRSR